MNTVEPIRDMNLVWDIADYLKIRKERNYVMFMFGIYSGLRISDILSFRVRDVKDKDYIDIREQKTNKEKRFPINDELKPIIKEYIKEKRIMSICLNQKKGRIVQSPDSKHIIFLVMQHLLLDLIPLVHTRLERLLVIICINRQRMLI